MSVFFFFFFFNVSISYYYNYIVVTLNYIKIYLIIKLKILTFISLVLTGVKKKAMTTNNATKYFLLHCFKKIRFS